MSSNVLPPSRRTGSSPAPLSKKKRRNRRKRKQVRAPAKKPAAQSSVRRQPKFELSECSRLYLQCLTNPFRVPGGLACIPDEVDVPSFKCLVIARGTFNVGTNQVGFVFVDPSTGCNNAGGIVSTTSTFSLTNTNYQLITQTPLGNMTQMPFASSSLSASTGLVHRTVGCGLRVRYTGTELNRSGRLIPYRSNAVRTSNPQGATVSQYLSRPDVPSDPCDRSWHYVSYLPTKSTFINTTFANSIQQGSFTQDSMSFTDYVVTRAVSDSSWLGYDLGFIVDGSTAGNGFEYEVYIHKEYCSADPLVSLPGISRSHSDVPGLSAVRNATENVIPVTSADTYYNQVYEYIRNWSPSDLSHVADYASSGMKVVKALGY